MQYSWVKIFHFDDSYLHVFHNLMYVNKIIWLKPLWNCCKREVSTSVTVEHTTFDMHMSDSFCFGCYRIALQLEVSINRRLLQYLCYI